jgi:hypothetical protein
MGISGNEERRSTVTTLPMVLYRDFTAYSFPEMSNTRKKAAIAAFERRNILIET